MARISIKGSASTAEAAAVSVAIERFAADTATAPAPPATGMNPWLRAALIEGVGAGDSFGARDPRHLA
jgi:hypothetical protein